ERVIRKSGELGMYWSVSASKFHGDRGVLAPAYGREMIDRWTFPLKELVDAGAKVTYEASSRRAHTTPFYDMEMFVTRKDENGEIWGFRNALDRSTVLKMMTRWGAEYVLREDKIGTLEPGKYADLLVLDKNPLDPNLPDENLSEIKILLTMVEGEIIFESPDSGL
ncbi:amidohydrolase family protein, partial [Acidobacteria bacterium AH-259-D05]|nr:amidohydrolase family protein [Acidobacteria bacterium AH-259-D05]